MLGIILQIIPGNGTKAVFGGSTDTPTYFKQELVCFALCEEEDDITYHAVRGMSSCGKDIFFVDDCPNFLGYEDPGESADWREEFYHWRGMEEERLNEVHTHQSLENLN